MACPKGGRYGDVRKTLAGLLQRPFAEVAIAANRTSDVPQLLDNDELVPVESGDSIIMARILKHNEKGVWVFE